MLNPFYFIYRFPLVRSGIEIHEESGAGSREARWGNESRHAARGKRGNSICVSRFYLNLENDFSLAASCGTLEFASTSL